MAVLSGCGADVAPDDAGGPPGEGAALEAGAAPALADAAQAPPPPDASSASDAQLDAAPDGATPAAGRDAATEASAPTGADGGVRDAAVADAAPSNSGCGAAAFCSGFEDQLGASLSGAWKTTAPNCSGDGSATLDTANVHSGQRALRVRSGGGVCNHIFAVPDVDLARFAGALWVRFYVRFESALRDDHVTFLALHDEVSQKDLRMGGQKQIFMWNREKDDATLPELSPNGVGMSVAPKVGNWHCVEFQLRGDQGLLETYVDGALVPGLVVDGTETHDIDGQWLRPGPFRARVTDLKLGWESYGGQPMTLWFDDVALGAERPGC